MRSLIAAADSSIQRIIAQELAARGHSVIHAADAEGALSAIAAEVTPIIIIMHDVAGATLVELCRRVRASPAGVESVVLALAPRGREDELCAAAAAGADTFHAIPEDDPTLPARLGVIERYAEDRTARRRAEANFRALVERSPSGIFVHRRGIIQYANPAMVSMLGYNRAEELLGVDTVATLIHPDDRPIVAARVAERAAGPHSELPPIEARWLRRDGDVVLLESTGGPIEYNGMLASLVLVNNVTLRKQLEAKLLLTERMVSMGTLAAGVAHEINNPLSYTLVNLDVIAEELRSLGGASPPARLRDLMDLVASARGGAERVRKIVRDLKSLSRADEEHRVTLDVRAVLDMSINITQNEIRHRASLVREYSDVPLVQADESRLAQVFINLLVNAAQAIPEGHPGDNEIRVVTRTDPSGCAIVEVRDTGVGIAPADLRRLFDPFFTTKPIGVGTGLGLSISHGIVTALGGEITVESAPLSGAMFRIKLPEAARAELRASTIPPPAAPSRRRGQVLVVDDDPQVVIALRRCLALEHDVDTARDGKEAIARIAAGARYDVVLSDLMMPGVTGMALHRWAAEAAPEQASRMVFMSGGTFTSEARRFLDEVPNERIDKPFSVPTLRALIRRMVG